MSKSIRGFAVSGALLLITGSALLAMGGCGDAEPVDLAPQVDEDGEVIETNDEAISACLGGGDVKTVRDAIALNCGGVAGCTNTTSTHDDLKLTDPSKYCSCYDWLWSQRTKAPYKNVQIIYHNADPNQCGSNYHIHLQKKNGKAGCSTTCNNGMQGLLHMDLDTSGADGWDANGNPNYCTANGGTYDRVYSCSCAASENKTGTCVNPSGGSSGGGGWNCANSAYNGVQYWTCSGGKLYKCVNGVPQTQTCSNGCQSNPVGTDDTCVSSSVNWNCANSAYNGQQYWTCSGGHLYKCTNGVPQKQTCTNGCNVNAVGTNDTCK